MIGLRRIDNFWNESYERAIKLLEEFSIHKELSDTIKKILLNNMLVVLEEACSKSIWSRGFIGIKTQKGRSYFLQGGKFNQFLIF